MKHAIDDDLKSICDEIAALGLSREEWLSLDRRTFWRGTCACSFHSRYPPGGAFHFKVKGSRDLAQDARPLRLEEVLDVSAGRLREIELLPPSGGIHPEDAGMRRVEVDPEVLFFAINDGTNFFIREVLVPRGLVNAEAYFNDLELIQQKHHVARHWAENWKVSWTREGGPGDRG